MVAVTGVAIGFAFDAGSGKELTSVFSGLYVVGCLAAVLAVRQSGIFTAVIQPPLILFGAVPGAYFLFHGAKFTGVKDLLINCGYPLIERFPLMLFTSAGVLALGLIRWYLGRFQTAAAEATDAADAASEDGRLGLVARLTAMFNREPADETVDKPARSRSRRTHAVERSARSTTSEARRTGKRPASTRTRRERSALGRSAPAGRWRGPGARARPASTPDARIRCSRTAPAQQVATRPGPACPPAAGRPARPAHSQRSPGQPLRPVRTHGALRRRSWAPAAAQAGTERDHRDPSPDLTGQVSEGGRRR